jgi:hypothetical protein
VTQAQTASRPIATIFPMTHLPHGRLARGERVVKPTNVRSDG